MVHDVEDWVLGPLVPITKRGSKGLTLDMGPPNIPRPWVDRIFASANNPGKTFWTNFYNDYLDQFHFERYMERLDNNGDGYADKNELLVALKTLTDQGNASESVADSLVIRLENMGLPILPNTFDIHEWAKQQIKIATERVK